MKGLLLVMNLSWVALSCGSYVEKATSLPLSDVSSTGITQLKIAAFNADILGKTKIGKPAIASYIADIIIRYDIILIQEIRDASEKTPIELLGLVNQKKQGVYALSTSRRLGRTSSKEQYAFYYRKDKGIKVESAEVFDDVSDVFEREPYIVKFSKNSNSFVLIGLHVKPNDAVNELNYLDDVYSAANKRYLANDFIILGDLNMDCSYVTDQDYQDLDLVKQGFTFNISKDLDTTSSKTNCAYDNIVSKSNNVSHAEIFNFKSAFGLDDSVTNAISNHYPVEFTLTL